MLWMIVFLFPCIQAFKMKLSSSEVGRISEEAISSVLRDSWVPGSSLIHVTDGGPPSISLFKVLQMVDPDSSVGAFEVSLKDQSDEASSSQVVNTLPFIDQIQRSSRGTTTVVLTSDDHEFVTDMVEILIGNELLIWPTKLLLVTRLPLQQLWYLRQTLSAINAMVVILGEESKPDRCSVYMYIPYSHRMVYVSSWSLRSGMTYHEGHRLFPEKYRRLSDGADLVVVGNNFPPHVTIQQLPAETTQEEKFSFSGPLLQLLAIIADNVNFTYSLTQPSDGSWGYLFPNGTWNGMIGMLLRNKADFALGPFGITYIRSRVIDYTNPLVVDYGQILGRRGDTEVDPWGFVMPLAPFVWAGTFVTLLVILGVVMLSSRISPDSSDSSSPFSKISLSTYVRAFLQQDIVVAPDSKWDRVMLGVWLLTVLVLLECYSTNLITLLAVRHIKEPYQYVRNVLDDPGVKMLWVANTAHAQYLSAVDSGIFYEVSEAGKRGKIRFISAPEYNTVVDQLVSQGDYVLMNPLLIMKMFLTEDFMDKGNCKFYVSRERFLPLTFCMVVPKHSPLRGPINEGIRAVVEGGLYNYWLDNSFSNAKSCKNPPTKITVKASLSLANLWGMFVVLVTGYVISTLVLCVEIACRWLHIFSRVSP